jgi:hypothetical protein
MPENIFWRNWFIESTPGPFSLLEIVAFFYWSPSRKLTLSFPLIRLFSWLPCQESVPLILCCKRNPGGIRTHGRNTRGRCVDHWSLNQIKKFWKCARWHFRKMSSSMSSRCRRRRRRCRRHCRRPGDDFIHLLFSPNYFGHIFMLGK